MPGQQQQIRTLWKDNTIRKLLGSVVVVCILTAVSVVDTWIALDIISRGHLSIAIKFLVEFYRQGTIRITTVLWYLGALLVLVLGWRLVGRLKTEWIRIVFHSALVAFLLPPSVFVYTGAPNPEQDIFSPEVFSSPNAPDSLLLPTLVCAVRYGQVEFAPFWEHFSLVFSLWLVPVVWLVVLCSMSLRRVRVLIMQQQQCDGQQT